MQIVVNAIEAFRRLITLSPFPLLETKSWTTEVKEMEIKISSSLLLRGIWLGYGQLGLLMYPAELDLPLLSLKT